MVGKGISMEQFHERVGLPVTLQSEFERPTLISSYRLGVGPYGEDSTGRMPKRWRLLGSEDGETWRIVDTRSDQTGWQNGEQRVYRLAKPGRYKYLRLEVSDVANGSDIFRLSSIRYFTPRVGTPRRGC